MPCEVECTQYCMQKLKSCNRQKLSNIGTTLRQLKEPDHPTDKGGSYHGNLWAYPVASSSALICKIDVDARKIRIIDVIFNL